MTTAPALPLRRDGGVRYPTTCKCGAPALPEWWGCAACIAKYDAALEAQGLREAVLAREQFRRRVHVPERFRDESLPGYAWRSTPALGAVWRYIASGSLQRGRALILLGATGCGKTQAMSAVVDYLAQGRLHSTWARWFSVPQLMRELANFDTQDQALGVAMTIAVLLLDDYGAGWMGKADGMAAGLFEEILTHRADEEKALVMTSNFTAEALRAVFTDRINDRLREWGQVVVVTGPSLRQAPPAEPA